MGISKEQNIPFSVGVLILTFKPLQKANFIGYNLDY
jgi:hypothetical protein